MRISRSRRGPCLTLGVYLASLVRHLQPYLPYRVSSTSGERRPQAAHRHRLRSVRSGQGLGIHAPKSREVVRTNLALTAVLTAR